MMKQLFHIDNGAVEPGLPQVLLMRIGSRHVAYAITDKEGINLVSLSYYINNTDWDAGMLEEWYRANTALQQHFYAVKLAYDYELAAVMPFSAYRNEEAGNISASLWGSTPDAVLSEPVMTWQVQTIFCVPEETRQWVTEKFPSAKTWHQYSVALRTPDAATPEGCLLADIRKDDFSLMIIKGSQLLMTQTYSYETPEDIIYCLVRATGQFGLVRETCKLKLSGLIDQQSALYKELYLYFIHISFRETAWKTGDCPSHFFAALNDLSRCE